MIGIEGAKALVLARLEAQMPAKVDELEQRYADNLAILRAPGKYAPFMVTRVEAAWYPIIMIGPRTDDMPTFVTQQGTYQTFRYPYRLRLYVVERGNSYEQVEYRRERLTLGMREVLTSSAYLSDSPRVELDLTSLRTTYFGTGEVAESDNRSIAATYTDLTVIVDEVSMPYPSFSGRANTIVSSVHPSQR